MSTTNYREAAKKRWPKFSKTERERGATILRRLSHLQTEKEQQYNHNNHWIGAEKVALEWVLVLIDDAHERKES